MWWKAGSGDGRVGVERTKGMALWGLCKSHAVLTRKHPSLDLLSHPVSVDAKRAKERGWVLPRERFACPSLVVASESERDGCQSAVGWVDVHSCSLKNLRRVAKDVGDYVGEEELVAMIDEFDQTGEGAIGLEDFLAIMQYASA